MSNASDIGIVPADFTDNALTDFGVTVSWEQATKTTDNITGDETLSYAEAVSKTVVFVRRTKTYEQSPEGRIELGDAYIMSQTSDGFVSNDKITYEGVTYLIKQVIRRRADGEDMFDYCILFKI